MPHSGLLLPRLPRAPQFRAPHHTRSCPAARPRTKAASDGSEGGQMLGVCFAGVHPAAPVDKALGLRATQRADSLRHLQECHGRAWPAARIRNFQRLVATITGEIETPVAVSSVEFIDPREPVMVIPILRAGLALVENASSVLPATKTYHLGLHRDEETLQPSVYLNSLPDKIPEGTRVLVVDPMLATGGTIFAVIDLLIDRGATSKQIKVVSTVAASPALQKLSEKFPGLHVYTGIIDAEVNEKGFIVPGLGDAGDRSFAT